MGGVADSSDGESEVSCGVSGARWGNDSSSSISWIKSSEDPTCSLPSISPRANEIRFICACERPARSDCLFFCGRVLSVLPPESGVGGPIGNLEDGRSGRMGSDIGDEDLAGTTPEVGDIEETIDEIGVVAAFPSNVSGLSGRCCLPAYQAFALSGDIVGSSAVCLVGVVFSNPSCCCPAELFLTFLKYSPSRIPAPPLKPYDLILTPAPLDSPFTSKV